MDFKSITVNVMFQKVRTIVTETSFTIDELEELYALFKVKQSEDVLAGNANVHFLYGTVSFLKTRLSL